ncbi:hypothetical protein T11_13868 [Trichinella zimbabwensis]|uniref:Uncharacterized protein n=1 Tax=Trichinella zimbabwensis TaxID=268475 RepID=A0A0V1HDW1_9BILA|nr:hypothetical protein T11_13868 [Trichinella zimbabwensis]
MSSSGSLLRVHGQSCAARRRSELAQKKTSAENEEAFKKFDHMLAFDHVRYQMCVPWTSAKTETSMTSIRRHYAVSR